MSEFQVISAAHAANYRYYHDWQDLSPNQKAKLVAHYVMTNLLDSHSEDARAIESERRSKKHG